MWADETPVRYRADQTGELREERRFADWSDIDAPADAPQAPQKRSRTVLRVVPPPEDAVVLEPAPEPATPKRTSVAPLEAVRLYLSALRDQYRGMLEESEEQQQRPPWER